MQRNRKAFIFNLIKQVEYQSKSLSPFDTHPISMWTSLGQSASTAWDLQQRWSPKLVAQATLKFSAMSFSSLEFFLQPP
ncbi:hypothetical protein ACB092_11G158600 [Castanea dentata]